MNATTSKLSLLLELKNKLFFQGLKESQEKLSLATDKMKNKLASLKTSHIEAFDAMKSASGNFGAFMQKLGNPYTALAAGAVGLAGALTQGVRLAAQFNNEFLQIKNLNLDKSAQELSQYKDLIQSAAFEMGTNLTKSSTAFYDIQSALGYYGKDVEGIFKTVSKYATATGADLNESVGSVTKAMKAFSLSVDQVQNLLESNAKTVQVGITTFKELTRVQTEYAGAAKGAGQSVDTANKIFAAFTSIAKDSNIAATMTKTAFIGLTQKNTIEGLQKIGVSLYDAQGQTRDLGHVLQELATRFKSMNPKQIDDLINKIGGPEGLRNLLIKVKTGADDFFKTLETFDASKFDLNKAFANAQQDLNVLTDMVKNRLNIALTHLGEMVLPTLLKSIEFLNNALLWGKKHWEDLSAILKMTLSLIGGFMIIRTVVTLYRLWTAGQLALNMAMLANPIVRITALIAILATAITLAVNKLQGWASLWQAFSITVQSSLKIIASAVKDNFNEIVFRLEYLWIRFKTIGERIAEFFANVFKAITLAAKGEFKEAFDALTQFSKSSHTGQLGALQEKRQEQLALSKKFRDENLSKIQSAWGNIRITSKKDSKESGASSAATSLYEMNSSKPAKIAALTQGVEDPRGPASIRNLSRKAQSPRSITINIEAFNKGTINVHQALPQNAFKDSASFENWFSESFIRMLGAAEESYG